MYPSQQNATDQTANFFWLLCIFFAAGLLLWWVDKKYIIQFVLAIRGAEIDLLLWMAEGYNKLAGWLGLPEPNLYHHLGWWKQFIASHPDYSKLNFAVLVEISSDVGKWMRIPVSIILLGLAMVLYTRHSTARFVRTYSLNSLRRAEVSNWPQISPIMNLNLVKEDIDKGPWAMAMTPLMYGQKHDLVMVGEKEGRKVWLVKKSDAYRQFVLQLGQLWRGPDQLPIHLKALLVIFIARSQRDRSVSDKLINQIAASSASGKLNFTGVQEALEKYRDSKILTWMGRRHAYVTTLFAAMLEAARSDGVLATSEILWLKPVDRRMWYVLNNVGRQTAFVEVAGVFAHSLAEQRMKRGLKTPMVQSAVTALEEAISDVLYKDEGDQWRSNAD
jgi:intracellular multiplication protein IcmP